MHSHKIDEGVDADRKKKVDYEGEYNLFAH